MKIKPVFVILFIALLYQINLAQELLARNVCGIPDKFLCQAVANGLKTALQQKNATVIQTFRQLSGAVPTGKDSTYFLSIKNNKELYQFINEDGSLGSQRDFPYWPKVKIQTTTSWFFDLDTIFRYAEFYPEFSESESSRVYSFHVSRKFSLFHDDFFVTRVDTNVEGCVEFDKETRLIKKLYFKHLIPKNESNKHKFTFVDRYTEYDVAFSDDELYPVPTKFVSNMSTSDDSVTIQVFYKDYKISSTPKLIEYPTIRYKLDTVARFLELDFTIMVAKSKNLPTPFDKDKVYELVVDYMSGTGTKTRICTAVAIKHLNGVTHVLTNTHCLEFAKKGYIVNKSSGKLSFVRQDITHLEDDISLISISNISGTDFILDVGGTKKKDAISLFGYPNGQYKHVTGTVIGTNVPLITDSFHIIRSATVSDIATKKGASGSAIIKNGKLIGILSSIGYMTESSEIITKKCSRCIPVSFFIDGNAIYKKLVKAGIL